jgi:hypothetical protein
MIYVLEDNKQYYTQKVDINELPRAICAIAQEYEATKVTLGGVTSFNNMLANEIMTTYSLNYGKNDLEIEVL